MRWRKWESGNGAILGLPCGCQYSGDHIVISKKSKDDDVWEVSIYLECNTLEESVFIIYDTNYALDDVMADAEQVFQEG